MAVRLPEFFNTRPGEALNAPPFEAESYIDFLGPPGSMTGLVYSVIFQLGKWGFYRTKIEEWINVSPVFKQYYDITIQQKQALEAQVKAGLAQIATAIHDYELVFHDLRKYREFLDHFTKIEKGKEVIKKKKEEGERLIKEGEQTLKAIFIDEVDVHTGEGIALKLIAPRWPTIIADFMKLSDEDKDPEKIAKKLKVSEAEGVVLATKNKLYIEWRDRLFKPTVTDRYQRILRLVEARRTSIDEYTNMLKPIITRFKMINDVLTYPETAAKEFHLHPLHRADAQAFSMDFMRIWAWRPFAPSEKYKMTMEIFDEIPIAKAGFSRAEIKLITEKFKKKKETANLTIDEELLLNKGRVYALPVEPSIDSIVRDYKPAVEKEYGVTIDIFDIFEARRRLTEEFSRRAAEAAETLLEATATERGVMTGAAWTFSPYFVFIDIPLLRFVIRMPDGRELEDLMIENLRTATKTQNVILIHLLEVIAREKQLKNYIQRMLGEVGADLKTIEQLAKEEFPEVFGKPEPKAELGKEILSPFKKIKNAFGDVLRSFGLTGDFVNFMRARGPYEFAMDDRITEIIQPEPGNLFQLFVSYLQQAVGVPGIKW